MPMQAFSIDLAVASFFVTVTSALCTKKKSKVKSSQDGLVESRYERRVWFTKVLSGREQKLGDDLRVPHFWLGKKMLPNSLQKLEFRDVWSAG
jgi:hypothetical protein